jgi:methylmalonyl-CoA/ethylmalonyl-CoA epimerase
MLEGINHIGIAVKSLDEAVRGYGALGAKQEGEVHKAADMNAVMLAVGESKLELMEPAGNGGVIGRFLESRGEGVHHICIQVDDIVSALASLKAQGVRLVDEKPRQGLEGLVAFIHPKSLNGVLVELVQVPKG